MNGQLWFLVLGFALTAQSAAADFRWDLNDVSILYPLPALVEAAPVALLGPETEGTEGVLLPFDDFKRIRTLLNNGSGNETLYKNALRVVSARIDPCPEEEACVPEVRLIWQPVEKDEELGKWTSRDGALHTFYKLSAQQFARLKASLWDIKLKAYSLGVDTSSKALGIHPAFARSESAEWFRQASQQAVLASCGSKNLKKITFMALLVPATWWRFGSMEKNASGSWETSSIPRLTMNFQDVFNSAQEEGGVSGPGKEADAIFNVLPESYPEEDNLHYVVNNGFRFNDARDLTVFREKLNAVARFQNPHRTNPRTLDCASCHYADAAQFYSGLRFEELKSYFSPDQFANPEPGRFNLKNETIGAKATRILRAFGYFDDQPALLQRVINDSAASADWLNKRN